MFVHYICFTDFQALASIYSHQNNFLSTKYSLFICSSISLSFHMLSLQRNLCICCTLSISLKEDGIVADYNGFKRRYTACYNPQLKCKYFNFSDYSLVPCMRKYFECVFFGNSIAKNNQTSPPHLNVPNLILLLKAFCLYCRYYIFIFQVLCQLSYT